LQIPGTPIPICAIPHDLNHHSNTRCCWE